MKRRRFVQASLAAGVAASAVGSLSPLGFRAWANAPAFARAAMNSESGRVLVILQLDGGNDGLNTVVPYQDPLYHEHRGDLAITNPLRIDDTLGWHPAMTGFERLFNDGHIAIVQNAGYPNPNRSHFRSTDIWFTGGNNNKPADENSVLDDGWIGRYLDTRYPGYPDPAVAPAHPLAIEIGSTTSLMMQGPELGMSMAIYDPETFYRIISGTDISGGDPPNTSTPAGLELEYIRNIALEANRYAGPVRDAAADVQNHDVYPDNNSVAERLKIVARLIAGGLETPIYVVTQKGYDTHAQQDNGSTPRHSRLLGEMSSAVAAFFEDLNAFGQDRRVLLMTISEFGRRVKTNGTDGTDHGTAAPMFFVGPEVNGGIFGNNPDLTTLDRIGDIAHEFDFKQSYASVLRQWFGVPPSTAALVLKGEWETLPLIQASTTATGGTGMPGGFALEQNYPNPFSQQVHGSTTIQFSTPGGHIRLHVYNIQGKLVSTLVDSELAAGTHAFRFSAASLPAGTYLYRLESSRAVETRSMVILK
ncbi:MAG: DUF1501 domain-containing protein [Bacteroidetes bacterium]|nr:DUF1501 domain-containing protein [Bacteroidota bacterium]